MLLEVLTVRFRVEKSKARCSGRKGLSTRIGYCNWWRVIRAGQEIPRFYRRAVPTTGVFDLGIISVLSTIAFH